jgi:hypothetical protein
MYTNRRNSRWQFPLWSLLVLSLIAPPIIAVCSFWLRETSAPLWSIGLGVIQFVFWLAVLVAFVVRRLSRAG